MTNLGARLSVGKLPIMNFLLAHSADPNLLSVPGRLCRAPSALITASVIEGQPGDNAIRTLFSPRREIGAQRHPPRYQSQLQVAQGQRTPRTQLRGESQTSDRRYKKDG